MRHWVYFLKLKGSVVYIGCTMDVPRRTNEHRRKGLRFDTCRAIKCKNLDIAFHYEKRWIAVFKPKYNKRGSGAKNRNIHYEMR